MLGKLLKYEFKSTARVFLPLYATLLVVAILNGFFLNSEIFNVQGLLMMVFGALLIALFVVTVIVLIQRFNKNLLGDEGYLMFTLPVKSSSILLSKYLVALLWTFLSVIVSVIAFFIIVLIPLYMESSAEFLGYLDILKEAINVVFGREYLPYAINMFLLMFTTYSTFIFTIYLALSMGQLPVFNKHRNLASFISFIGINVVFSFIKNTVIVMFYDVVGEQILLNMQDPISGVGSILYNGFVAGIVMNFVLLVGLFIGTKFILDKKLNLE
ncbi:MAG: ABC transporter permease [Peptostreptococcaceae bacterium]